MKNYYLDSDTIIGYIKAEFCRTGYSYQVRDYEMGQFFAYCSHEGHTLLLSIPVLEAIKRKFNITQKDLDIYLSQYDLKIRIISVTDEVKALAEKYKKRGVHYDDNIHAAFAKVYGACLVTYNDRDYGPVKKEVDVKLPSQVY